MKEYKKKTKKATKFKAKGEYLEKDGTSRTSKNIKR